MRNTPLERGSKCTAIVRYGGPTLRPPTVLRLLPVIVNGPFRYGYPRHWPSSSLGMLCEVLLALAAR